MKFTFFNVGLLSSLLLTSPTFASITTLNNAFQNFNAVILGDYDLRNETEGSTFVGGQFNPLSGARNIAFNSGSVDDNTQNVLFLNNGVSDINLITTIQSGSVISRTALDPASFNLNGSNNGSVITTGEQAFTAALNEELGINSAAEFSLDIEAASLMLSGLTANSTAAASNNGAFFFDASMPSSFNSEDVAVFNINGSELTDGNNLSRLELQNTNTTVIINVSGEEIVISRNFSNGFSNNEANILFNFFEATDITINSNVRGSILAPLATVDQNSNIDGDIIALNLDQSSEVHNVGFEGIIPVPEPSSILLLATGAGFTLLRRKRIS